MSKRTRGYALGDGSYDGLSGVAVDALRKMAGYVPDACGDDLPPTLDDIFEEMFPEGVYFNGDDNVAAEKHEALEQWFKDVFGVDLEALAEASDDVWFHGDLETVARHTDKVFVPKIADITNHREMPRINGVIQLPKMTLVDGFAPHLEIFDVWEWCKDRAWVAGGSVVEMLVEDSSKFITNDFDVFLLD